MNERLKILVTGATGFVGRTLCSKLEDLGHLVIRTSRVKTLDHTKLGYFITGDLSTPINWKNALIGVDIVIHLAAKVHILKDIIRLYQYQYYSFSCTGGTSSRCRCEKIYFH